MAKAVLYDSTLCVGCKACESACSERWGLPYNDKIAAEERLSAHKMTAIRDPRRSVQPPAVHALRASRPVPRSARLGALQKTALGPVVYDADKCMGCRYCMTACPFQVPTYEWDKRLPQGAQVRHVLRAPERREAHRLHGSLPDRRHHLRRARRHWWPKPASGWRRSRTSTTRRSTD